jgi:hypothetical protein
VVGRGIADQHGLARCPRRQARTFAQFKLQRVRPRNDLAARGCRREALARGFHQADPGSHRSGNGRDGGVRDQLQGMRDSFLGQQHPGCTGEDRGEFLCQGQVDIHVIPRQVSLCRVYGAVAGRCGCEFQHNRLRAAGHLFTALKRA